MIGLPADFPSSSSLSLMHACTHAHTNTHLLLPIQTYRTISIQLVSLPSDSMQPPLLSSLPRYLLMAVHICAHIVYIVFQAPVDILCFSLSCNHIQQDQGMKTGAVGNVSCHLFIKATGSHILI